MFRIRNDSSNELVVLTRVVSHKPYGNSSVRNAGRETVSAREQVSLHGSINRVQLSDSILIMLNRYLIVTRGWHYSLVDTRCAGYTLDISISNRDGNKDYRDRYRDMRTGALAFQGEGTVTFNISRRMVAIILEQFTL